MLQTGPRRRKLAILNQSELFDCWRLGCRISYRSCGMRHAKGAALRQGENYAWVPEQWAKYAFQCRTCPEGAKNQAGLALHAPRRPGPNKPPSPVPMGRSKATTSPGTPFRTCRKCPRLFRTSGVICVPCRRQIRSAALRRAS